MKNIEEIREKLGPDYRVEVNDGVITVCSIWDGVEYVRCIQSGKGGISGSEIFEGQIYKVKGWANEYVMLISGFEIGWEPDGVFTPATEDEYVEQLKIEADIWKGVEFAIADYNGIIYKIDRFETSPMKKIWFSHGKFLFPEKCKPSTESAYVEQLKAKAHELYGEINDGDRFELNGVEFRVPTGFDLRYVSEHDKLVLDNYMKCPHIYQQGKWAKKVDEPIRVNVSSVRYFREPIEYMGEIIPSGTIDCTVHFTIEGSSPKIILKDDLRKLLSKCLEEYLNKS